MTPFEQKCKQAASQLRETADRAYQDYGNRQRLMGKAAGLELALSYLKDYPHEGEAAS